jgi:uncharacterized protein
MKRLREADLQHWAARQERKPLILRGARQVGKSHLVRTWGASRFERVVELNLERDPAIASCFSDNDPQAILKRLEIVARASVPSDGSVLLFLDEIQAEPSVLAKLRWFAEELPRLPIVAAGSLLDFALREPAFSMPVGRVTFMHLEPLGFREFVSAMGEQQLADQLATLREENFRSEHVAGLATMHDRALDLFRQYLLVGGMPAAVASYRESRSLLGTSEVHSDLLAALRSDFAKYAARVHHGRLNSVLSSIAQQLGGKFRYVQVDRSERAQTIAQAVELLSLARVCHRVRATPAVAVPLAAGVDEKRFKLILLDVGLLSALLGLSFKSIDPSGDIMLAHRGALAEQVVGQLLRLCRPAYEEPALYHWHRESRGSEAEIDYVAASETRVIPIEVKAGATGALRSLHLYMAERGFDTAVRFNADLPSVVPVAVSTRTGASAQYRLLSLPMYMVEELPRLLEPSS